MRIKRFGVIFSSKRALAEILGVNPYYSPRLEKGAHVNTSKVLSERDIMRRFNIATKDEAREWIQTKILEAKAK